MSFLWIPLNTYTMPKVIRGDDTMDIIFFSVTKV